jgi:hypothetical protein
MARIVLLAALLALLPSTAVASSKDRNRDRIPDRWEHAHGVSVAHDHSGRDADRDGLTTYAEWRSGTDPRRADSDRDGRPDGLGDRDRDGLRNGFEVAARTDPGRRDSDRDRVSDGREDPDRDGLDNAAEQRFGLEPRHRDSDVDGVRDGGEGAGVVVAVGAGRIVLALASGGRLDAALDPDVAVVCAGHDETEDDDLGDGGATEDAPAGDDGPAGGDDDDGPGEDDDAVARAARAGCPGLAGLRAGALVRAVDAVEDEAGVLTVAWLELA